MVNLPGDISQNKTDSPFSRISSSYDRGEPSSTSFLSMLSFGLDQGGFIKEIQVWFNIQKPTNEIYHIKTQEQKVYNHFIGYKERPFKKPKDPSSWKCWTWNLGTQGIYLNIIKSIYRKSTMDLTTVILLFVFCLSFCYLFSDFVFAFLASSASSVFDSLYHFSSIMAFCYYCEL